MLDLYELEQFVAFAELGTLSRVAEKFHISTPAITRSCAPAPLWKLLPKLNAEYPGMMVSSVICQNEEVLAALKDGSCDIGILLFPLKNSCEFMQENLFVCVPPEHELAHHKALTFKEINGFNFLLRTELGFWDTLCREKMPASKFLVQTDAEAHVTFYITKCSPK